MSAQRSAPPFAVGFGSLAVIGCLLRIWAFVVRGSLGNDEAALALNIVGRDLADIARPLLYQQSAPYLYLITSKLAVLVLGPNEHALRALSLVCGCLLLPITLLFVRAVSGWTAALFALALLTANPALLYGASTFKPFAVDALISSGLCLLTSHALSHAASARRALIALGVCGALAPWFSLPSIFVLGGSATALVIAASQQPQRTSSALLLPYAFAALWLTSFGVHYLSFKQVAPPDAGYAHAAPDLLFYVRAFFRAFDVFVAHGGFGLRYVAAALWGWGVYRLWKQQRAVSALVLLPWLLVATAAGAQRYGLHDQQLAFLVPMILTPVVSALVELAQLRGAYSQLLTAVLAVLLCAGPSRQLARALGQPAPESSIAQAVHHLQERYRPGDVLYVEKQLEWVYTFYARRERFSAPFPSPDDRLDEPTPSYETLDSLRGKPRVWVLLPAAGRTDALNPPDNAWSARAEALATTRLNSIGRAVDVFDGGSARLYLYDLSPAR